MWSIVVIGKSSIPEGHMNDYKVKIQKDRWVRPNIAAITYLLKEAQETVVPISGEVQPHNIEASPFTWHTS